MPEAHSGLSAVAAFPLASSTGSGPLDFSLSTHSCAPGVPDDVSSKSSALLKSTVVNGMPLLFQSYYQTFISVPYSACVGRRRMILERASLSPSSLAASPDQSDPGP